MGLFDKKYCDICGEKIGMLGNRKLEDGNCCKDCAKKLSPWFSERRSSTVAEIKEQLADREANRAKVKAFHTTREFHGTSSYHVFIDDTKQQFAVATKMDTDLNPDILDLSSITSCRLDINERREEKKYKNQDGQMVSYQPPLYDYKYDYRMIITLNTPWISEIKFDLNTFSVESRERNRMVEMETLGKQITIALGQQPGSMQSGMYNQQMNGMQGGMYGQQMSGMAGAAYGQMNGMQGNAYGQQMNGMQGNMYGQQMNGMQGNMYGQQMNGMQGNMYGQQTNGMQGNMYGQQMNGMQGNMYGQQMNGMQGNMYDQQMNGMQGGMYDSQMNGMAQNAGDGSWICQNCGNTNTGKFCIGCGQQRSVPMIRCDKCGWVAPDPSNVPKFCPSCGDPIDRNDMVG